MRIAYVEDEPDIRELAKMALEMVGGMDVDAHDCGATALACIPHAPRPDVLLLDVMMPDMDGPTLLGHLWTMSELSDVPAIFMTAKSLPSEIAQLYRTGAIAVIPKPFDPMTLADTIRQSLTNHSARRGSGAAMAS